MRRFTGFLSLALVVLIGFVPGEWPPTRRRPRRSAMSSHPIVGAWLAILTGTGGAFAEMFRTGRLRPHRVSGHGERGSHRRC